jgi:hypothetical protein
MLVVAALIASGSAQVFMAMELRRMRLGLAAGKGIPPRDPDEHTSHYTPISYGPAGSTAGYAIYVYRSDRWELEADLSAPGFEPSPPTLRGAYEGQVIKKESAAAPGR